MVKKAILFPGQGSQYIGMGKKLCENHKVASDIYDEASEALGFDLKKMCFQGNLDELTQTYNAPPAILTNSYAMFKVFEKEEEIVPDIMVGHSLGEISALTCANAIAFGDAVKIARKRGEFMQNAVSDVDGAMVAVMTRDMAKVQEICKTVSADTEMVADIANYNSKTQYVISGNREAVDQISDILAQEDIKTKILKVSAPFHCSLMQPAADIFKEELGKYTFHDPECLVLSNVTATPYQNKDQIIDNLVQQLVNPVRWIDCMTYLKKAMVIYGVQVGPGKVLKNLMKTNVSDIKIFAYDVPAEIEQMQSYIKKSYIPFLSRCMGLAVATKNNNWDSEKYNKGVVEPYNNINLLQQQIDIEGRKATFEEMKQGIKMLKSVFETKGTPKEEMISRFKDLFSETGTESIFADFDCDKSI